MPENLPHSPVQSERQTEANDHWENQWPDAMYDTNNNSPNYRRARDISDRQNTLLGIVATGEIDTDDHQQTKTLNEFDNWRNKIAQASEKRGEINYYSDDEEFNPRPQNAGEAAYALYLSLGPNNQLAQSEGVMTALAARMLNQATEASGDPLISQKSFDMDFFSDDTLQTRTQTNDALGQPAETVSQTELELLRAFWSNTNRHKNLEIRLQKADPTLLLGAGEILADAARSNPNSQANSVLTQTSQKILEALAINEAATEKQKAHAANIYFDTQFAKLGEADAGDDAQIELMKNYTSNAAKLIQNIPNGAAAEVFVPLIMRHAAYQNEDLNALTVRHASTYEDAPQLFDSKGRTGSKDKSDIIVGNRATPETTKVQLKLRPNARLGYSNEIEVSDAGMSEIINEYTNLNYGELIKNPGHYNSAVMNIMQACAERITTKFYEGSMQTSEAELSVAELGVNKDEIDQIIRHLGGMYAAKFNPATIDLTQTHQLETV